MKNIIFLFLLILLHQYANAQLDSSLFIRQSIDSSQLSLNMDAVYNRPFLAVNKLPVSVGGYVEANWQHLSTDGISEGHQFQFRRMSIFIASTISRHIKFLTELEFENELEGDESKMELGIEYAAVDFELHQLLNLRGGIVLTPIGAFNQNHDAPKWEFVDRPIAMTEMLPATWKNAGFGIYGKQYSGQWMYGYELYLTGGFNNAIIDNDKSKTFLPEAKDNSRLMTIASGEPMISSKVSIRKNQLGELGLSYMTHTYNKYMEDGVQIDDKRRLHVLDIDFNTNFPKLKTNIIGEWAWVFVQVPENYLPTYGQKQRGGFVDIIHNLMNKKIFNWNKAAINLSLRLEYVDWNVGILNNTGQNIADDLWSIMPSISIRPTPQTVLRLNYRYMQQSDFIGNPPARTSGLQFGIATYF